MKKYFWIISFIPMCWFFNSAIASNLACKGKLIENRGISTAELYEKADVIFLGQVGSYTLAEGHPIFPGYYTFYVLHEIKGGMQGEHEVWGSEPLEYLPQHYIDITQYHNSKNFDALYGGVTGIIELNGECVINPKLKKGYNYLVLLGVETEFAFEPINSPNFDLYYQRVASGQ